METRSPHPRLMLVPAAFALVCVVLTFLLLKLFGGALPLGAEGYRVTVPLPDATNLVQGSDVQQAGVRIGRVVSVARVGSRARAEIELESEFAPLRSGARATVRVKTLLGEGYLEVAPGPRGAPVLRDGGTLAARQVRETVQLDEFLQTFDAPTRARFRSFLGGFARAVKDRAPELSDALGSSAPLATGFEEVLLALDGQRRSLQTVFARAGVVFDAIGRQEGAVRRAVTAGDDLFGALAARDRELTATVRALPGFLGELRRSATVVEAAAPDLDRAAVALGRVAPQAAPALRALERDVPSFTGLFEDLRPVLRASRGGFPALTRVVRAARPSLNDVLPSVRELTPIMQLMAEYRLPSLLGPLSNVGSFTNGTMVGPGGRILHRGGGAITVWNESIGGWKKRLPTNRANPYLKPDGLRSLGREPLNSYDCRNTGNPLYVPPTGTGAPPCVEQGPWEYRGKRAYYPRLSPTPVE